MTRFAAILAAAILMLSLAACAPAPPPAPAAPEPVPPAEVPDALKTELKTAVQMLGGSLKARLSAELGEHGPLEALNVCSLDAPRLTAEAATEGITVRRVTLKTRNPSGTPLDFERAQLERFAQQLAEGALPPGEFTTRIEDGRTAVYFFKPLLIESACLNCHGAPDAMQADLVARLDELYPDDQATGYAEGDLRGMFSARTVLN